MGEGFATQVLLRAPVERVWRALRDPAEDGMVLDGLGPGLLVVARQDTGLGGTPRRTHPGKPRTRGSRRLRSRG